jgi:hypothetical protein
VGWSEGRKLSIPLVYFHRLLNATPEQREKYEMSEGRTGLHWEEVERI